MKLTQSYSYLEQLNEVQRQAVENVNGASMVIAGAGSGKTRVLTYRIAHMLNMGIKPYQIMALTFTNKAAREMKTRIAQIIGEETARYLWMGTFHSIFAKILSTPVNPKFTEFTNYTQTDVSRQVLWILMIY